MQSTGAWAAGTAGLYFQGGKPAKADPNFRAYLGNLMDEFRGNAATMSKRPGWGTPRQRFGRTFTKREERS